MKSTTIALLAVALIATAPAAFAQAVSGKTSGEHHSVLKKHPPHVSGYAQWRAMQARGLNWRYPEAFGYAPNVPRDYNIDASRQAGGGGGGGGGGGM